MASHRFSPSTSESSCMFEQRLVLVKQIDLDRNQYGLYEERKRHTLSGHAMDGIPWHRICLKSEHKIAIERMWSTSCPALFNFFPVISSALSLARDPDSSFRQSAVHATPRMTAKIVGITREDINDSSLTRNKRQSASSLGRRAEGISVEQNLS